MNDTRAIASNVQRLVFRFEKTAGDLVDGAKTIDRFQPETDIPVFPRSSEALFFVTIHPRLGSHDADFGNDYVANVETVGGERQHVVLCCNSLACVVDVREGFRLG